MEWNTPQGKTRGKVTRKLTGSTHAGGHVAKPTPGAPQLEVQSETSGKRAIHKPGALRKVG